jgi:hypothetical protein
MTSAVLHTTLSLTEDAGNRPRNKESNSTTTIPIDQEGKSVDKLYGEKSDADRPMNSKKAVPIAMAGRTSLTGGKES